MVDSGTLTCEPPRQIIFTTEDNIKYGVNGAASESYPSILIISKDTENLGARFKMPVNKLIDVGMMLCK